MEYQYGQNNDEQNNNAWNNEWSNHSESNNNPYQQDNLGTDSGKGSNGGGGNNKKHGKGLIAIAMVAVLVIGILLGNFGTGIFNSSNNETASLTTKEETESTQTGLEEATQEEDDSESQVQTTTSGQTMSVEQIAAEALPSIVAITNKGETEILSMWGTLTQESESAGSGIIVGETDDELLIVTNYHVVEGNDSLSVLFSYQDDSDDPEIATAKVKDYDESQDLAVISIDKSTLSSDVLDNIKVAEIGDSSELALGEQIVAIGNALGYGQSVTTGIVSALDRSISLESEDGSSTTNNKYIQVDAAINPGNSGGGLFNMEGELVGINSAKVASEEVEGMGYSIPISSVSEEVQNMMNAETRDVVSEDERGYLGISGTNVTSEINQTYDIPMGVYISAVAEGSPAETAGLQKGMVITEMNDKSISSIESLKEYLSYYQAGEQVDLTVQVQSGSGYTEQDITVTLGTQEEAGISSQESTTDSDSGSSDQGSSDQGNYGSTEDPYSDFFNYFNQQNGN